MQVGVSRQMTLGSLLLIEMFSGVRVIGLLVLFEVPHEIPAIKVTKSICVQKKVSSWLCMGFSKKEFYTLLVVFACE